MLTENNVHEIITNFVMNNLISKSSSMKINGEIVDIGLIEDFNDINTIELHCKDATEIFTRMDDEWQYTVRIHSDQYVIYV